MEFFNSHEIFHQPFEHLTELQRHSAAMMSNEGALIDLAPQREKATGTCLPHKNEKGRQGAENGLVSYCSDTCPYSRLPLIGA
jgi:hypothetical protein